MSDWVEVFNYYDGYLEGLLFKDGEWHHWLIKDDSPGITGPGERVYELRLIGHEPTSQELVSLTRDVQPTLRSLEVTGTIMESVLRAIPLKEEL